MHATLASTALSLVYVSFARYAEALASTRVLKHSPESANGKCGENLAWASYDQPGKLLVFAPVS